MYDIRKLIDPLLLGMKVRDSMKSGDPSHIQDYMLDVLKNSIHKPGDAQGGLQGGTSRAPGNLDIQKQIQDTLSQSLSQIQGVPGMGESSHLQNYIQSILNQSLSQSLGNTMGMPPMLPNMGGNFRQAEQSSKENAEVFQTHDYVFVRVPVPDQVDERRIDMHIGLNRVVLKWAPGGKEHVIQLPVDVKNEGVAAAVKNRILEIKMPKEKNPDLKKVRIQRE